MLELRERFAKISDSIQYDRKKTSFNFLVRYFQWANDWFPHRWFGSIGYVKELLWSIDSAEPWLPILVCGKCLIESSYAANNLCGDVDNFFGLLPCCSVWQYVPVVREICTLRFVFSNQSEHQIGKPNLVANFDSTVVWSDFGYPWNWLRCEVCAARNRPSEISVVHREPQLLRPSR